ncbi:Sucrase/ferredoxin-like-domain-containing protein [Phycomyces blakesleeanus]|uniref:Altered inheritance of mitochondria protein 32 n=2 Tax=Phycomyces blakesleeanus TaxID=4837 RepID=A0A162PW38_PHYB8|nr:hypothetical protein PHYBLDRAFT_165075 [Phycomyces blakesleeanus NRRL 1555(-)]OAD76547.1 hypothetical protein PHYBLDRAFT_165075 [Phycomyces blakesleeanus NRRL 1555(-)]|eukprot:XP_018294587.1 hypothetical protein PHYBLDRAFT_165075 [Phycomyces blakesleeanus NRRL 1555(-)]
MSFYLRKGLSFLGVEDKSAYPPAELLADDDCLSCQDPCAEHKPYPSSLKIDQNLPLVGSVKPYGRHIIISTGKSDWPSKIEKDTGSLAHALRIAEDKQPTQLRNFVTNASLVATESSVPNGHDVVVLPDNIYLSNVTPENALDFWEIFINTPLPLGENPEKPNYEQAASKGITVKQNPYESMIMICSHRKRDKACGITAPILADEFEHILRDKDISETGPGSIVVWMVSHVGGHKYAGNVICYTQQGTCGVWYGRVATCDCNPIIEETILKGKIIKELYRGSMDHSFDKKLHPLKW